MWHGLTRVQELDRMKKAMLMIAGILCMIAGLIGLLLPVIPQIPFFVCGAVLLMLASRRFCSWVASSSFYQKHAKKYISGNRILSRIFEKTGLEAELEMIEKEKEKDT